MSKTEERASGTILAHYRIIKKIGSGGMGEVYLAKDTKLERTVALKFLPAKFTNDHDRMRRFVQEARAAAALNHPHIAHVYEIGESAGSHFIAMEYVDGETLREKIQHDGGSLSKLLKYLTQVAEGLTKAHAAGIVHRDLKPDNIMITRDDYAKILDFGLAKLVERTGAIDGASNLSTAMGPQHSKPGIVMGTVGYMSPEQAQGKEIDHRSDIFSFGCILYEAATGLRAFKGKDVLDSLHKTVTNRMKSLMSNACAVRLNELAKPFERIVEAFVMDNRGALVCTTRKTSDYWQGDEPKWQQSYLEGKGAVFVEKAEYDESTKTTIIHISVPVMNGQEAIGAITVGMKRPVGLER